MGVDDEYIKHKQKRIAKIGDTIKIVRDSTPKTGGNITKGKLYEVTHTSHGWGGQAVTFIGDNGRHETVNGRWWDFDS